MAIFTNMKYNATKAILISVCLILACSSDSEADSNVYNPGDNVDETDRPRIVELDVSRCPREGSGCSGAFLCQRGSAPQSSKL